VVIEGPLGSGKTFFVRALCRALGLPASEPVTSPTFALVVEHATTPPVAHADLYRLETDADVAALGLDAAANDGKLVLVEWGARFTRLLGPDVLLLELDLEPRRLRLSASGPRSRRALSGLPGELIQEKCFRDAESPATPRS
jgi:tRNA threonylcarbamoyladenosine biosynthesis protein TsaE